MNKFLQSLFFLVSLSFLSTLHAQEILLEELFNEDNLGVFTGISVIGDGQQWQAREFDGKKFAQMNGFDGGIQDNEDWLISPALDMDLYNDEVLTFENASNFDGPDLEVMVSTDYDGGGDPNSATWTDLSENVTWSTGGFEYVLSGDLDLSSFSGTGYIAFKYISNSTVEGKLWQVDSIVVKASILSDIDETEKEEALISAPQVQGDQLVFDILVDQPALQFALYALDGKFIKQFNNNTFRGTVNLTVANIPAGMYLLQVKSKDRLQSHRFIKH